MVMWAADRSKRYGLFCGRGKLFFRSIDRFFSSMKTVGATDFGGLSALKWAWHVRALRTKLNLNLKSQFSIFDSFRDISVQIYEVFEVCGR